MGACVNRIRGPRRQEDRGRPDRRKGRFLAGLALQGQGTGRHVAVLVAAAAAAAVVAGGLGVMYV
jgi:hypothetical protein